MIPESSNNIIDLLAQPCNFDIFDAMPHLFTLTTKNNSCKFNSILLAETSSVICDFIKENPEKSQYDLNIIDKKNVLRKFEQIYQGKYAKFNEDELEIARMISNKLNLGGFSEFINSNIVNLNNMLNKKKTAWERKTNLKKFPIQESTNYFEYTKNSSVIRFNQLKIINYIKHHKSHFFRIQTKKREYKCNFFGVFSSSVIRDLVSEDPSIDHYFYDFEDENDEFQLIEKIFNFESVKMSASNADILKEMADDLDIECILKVVNEFVTNVDIVSQSIDDQQTFIDSIDDLFDLLFNIKEKTVDSVSTLIKDSRWSQNKDNVNELSSLILHVIRSDIQIQQNLIDLLLKIDNESTEKVDDDNDDDDKSKKNNLKLLLPLIIKQSISLFSKKIIGQNHDLIFPFVFLMYKRGIIPKDTINSILSKSKLDNKYFVSWFLPELAEFHSDISRIDFENNYIVMKSKEKSNTTGFNPNSNDMYLKRYCETKQFYPCDVKSIEEYVAMRDKGEYDDYLARSLRNDDVDSFQSFVSKNQDKLLKNTINMNIFEPFFQGNTRYLNYAAAYGSIKCFKYLLLNNEKVDQFTFQNAVIGGNNELIRIVDNEKIEPQKGHYYYQGKTNQYNSIMESLSYTIQMHKNELFDWIFEQKFQSINENGKLISLIFHSITNCNLHSFVHIIDNGFEFHNFGSFYPQFIGKATKKSFYLLTMFIMNLINSKIDSKIAIEILVNCLKIESKDVLNYITEKLNKICPFNPDMLITLIDKKSNFEIWKQISDLIYQNDSKSNFTNLYLKAINLKQKNLIELFIDKKYFKNEETLSTSITQIGNIDLDIFKLIINDANIRYKKILLNTINEAIKRKNIPLIKYLLNEKAPLNEALLLAVQTNDLEIVEIVLNKNSKPSFINKLSKSGNALILAVKNNSLPIIKKLLSIPGIDPSIYCEKFVSPLVYSAYQLKYKIFELIFDFYGEEGIKEQKWQLENAVRSIIDEYFISIQANKLNDVICKILLKIFQLKCIDPNIQSKFITPLMFSFQLNNIELVKTLLEYDTIDLNIYNPETGDTPLILSIKARFNEVTKYLIKNPKININEQNYKGESALIVASMIDDTEIMKLLISNDKFDPEESDINLAFSNSNFKDLLSFKTLDVNCVPNAKVRINIFGKYIVKSPLINSILQNDFETFNLIIHHPSFIKDICILFDAIYVSIHKQNEETFTTILKLFDDINIDINSNIFDGNNLLLELINLDANELILSSILNYPKFDPKKSDLLGAIDYLYSKIFISDHKSTEKIKNILLKSKSIDLIYEYDIKHDHLIDLKSLLDKIYSVFFDKQEIEPNELIQNSFYPLEFAIRKDLFILSLCLINSNKIDFNQKIFQSNENGKYFSSKSKSDYTSYLHIAAKFGRFKVIDEILSNHSCNVNITNNNDETPLIEACKFKQIECVKSLFKADDLDFLHCNSKGEDSIKILRKMLNTNQNDDHEKEIKNKDEYLSELLNLLNLIQQQTKIENEKQVQIQLNESQISNEKKKSSDKANLEQEKSFRSLISKNEKNSTTKKSISSNQKDEKSQIKPDDSSLNQNKTKSMSIADYNSKNPKFETYNESFSEEPDPNFEHFQIHRQHEPKMQSMKRESLIRNRSRIHHNFDEEFDDSAFRQRRKVTHSKSSHAKRRIRSDLFVEDDDDDDDEINQAQFMFLQQQQQQWFQMIQMNNELQTQINVCLMNQAPLKKNMKLKKHKK